MLWMFDASFMRNETGELKFDTLAYLVALAIALIAALAASVFLKEERKCQGLEL